MPLIRCTTSSQSPLLHLKHHSNPKHSGETHNLYHKAAFLCQDAAAETNAHSLKLRWMSTTDSNTYLTHYYSQEEEEGKNDGNEPHGNIPT